MRRIVRWMWAKRWRRWTAVGGALFVVASIGSVEATSQSRFCNSCHIMGTYYQSWKTSAHKDVACVKCHIEPGADGFIAAKLNGLGQVVDDVLHRTSTKPSASVSQLSCTRSGCHSVETLSSHDVKKDTFRFAHSKHLGAKHLGVEISCGTCHSHVKGDQHFEVNTGVCFTCHLLERARDDIPAHGTTSGPTNGTPIIRMAVREGHAPTPESQSVTPMPANPAPPPAAHPNGNGEKVPPSSCATCHEAPQGEFEYRGLMIDHADFLGYGAACESCHRGTTSPPQAIGDAACLECHTFGVERALPVKEMHRVHSLGRHKIECFNCHGTVHHGPTAQTMTFQQFDCRRCHIDQHAVQRSAYLTAHEPEESPPSGPTAVNPMFLAHVDCTGCHTERAELDARPGSGAGVNRASAKSCDNCHQAGLGERLVPMWQQATRTLYDTASEELAEVRPAPDNERARSLLDEAGSLINLVRIDGSWGVHNPMYTQRILDQARERIRSAKAPPAPGGSP